MSSQQLSIQIYSQNYLARLSIDFLNPLKKHNNIFLIRNTKKIIIKNNLDQVDII